MKKLLYALAIVILPTCILAQQDWTVYYSPTTVTCPIEFTFKRSNIPLHKFSVFSSLGPQIHSIPTWVSSAILNDKVGVEFEAFEQTHLHFPAASNTVRWNISKYCGCYEYKFIVDLNYSARLITIVATATGWAMSGSPCEPEQDQ